MRLKPTMVTGVNYYLFIINLFNYYFSHLAEVSCHWLRQLSLQSNISIISHYCYTYYYLPSLVIINYCFIEILCYIMHSKHCVLAQVIYLWLRQLSLQWNIGIGHCLLLSYLLIIPTFCLYWMHISNHPPVLVGNIFKLSSHVHIDTSMGCLWSKWLVNSISSIYTGYDACLMSELTSMSNCSLLGMCD